MITTHVLDTSAGQPAVGLAVTLDRRGNAGDWEHVGTGQTNDDGRVSNLVAESSRMIPGEYRLTFETRAYFDARNVSSFYPAITIAFIVSAGVAHYHVPLLLSPFGYSTYRGS